MIRTCKKNTESVISKVRRGELDAASLGMSNIIDEIILAMHTNGYIQSIQKSIIDHRQDNTVIPYEMIWSSAIAAKMKIRTSLTDIPFAITDSRTLAELGYTLIDTDGKINARLMRESSIRALLSKYQSNELFSGYSNVVQNYVYTKLGVQPNIHILDCTDLEVNFTNTNYEQSGISVSKNNVADKNGKQTKKYSRGYKLSTLRGIVGDSGFIEDIRFGALNVHDLELSREMILHSPVLKNGDIIINDRGFLSRKVMDELKILRFVDTYVPLRENMDGYKFALQYAIQANAWETHPNKKRMNQKISFVPNIEFAWSSEEKENSIPLNACVVWDTNSDNYFVCATTDTTKTAKEIIRIYELRPEIEEDYRQLKEFWKLEDFKSTKLNTIAFHIVCVLFGYLFFQIYTMLPEGYKFSGKSLPVLLKSYDSKPQSYVVLYVDYEFGIVSLLDLMKIYSACNEFIKRKIESVIALI